MISQRVELNDGALFHAVPSVSQRHIRHEAFERSPDVRGPATADAGRWANERLKVRLPYVEQIFEVGDQLQRAELLYRDRHQVEIRLRLRKVRIVVEHLAPVIDAFDAPAVNAGLLEHQVSASAMAIEQRNRLPLTRLSVILRSARVAVREQKLVV